MPTVRRFEVEGPYTQTERDGLLNVITGSLIYNSTTNTIDRYTGTVWKHLVDITGTTILDFGAFPGASDASVAVTGQNDILASSVINVNLAPIATADHTADEHLVESLRVFAGNIVAGTGFTIYGVNDAHAGPTGDATRIWGKWTVVWSWN